MKTRNKAQDGRAQPFVSLNPFFLVEHAAKLGPTAIGVLTMLAIWEKAPLLDRRGQGFDYAVTSLAAAIGCDNPTADRALAKLIDFGFLDSALALTDQAYAPQ